MIFNGTKKDYLKVSRKKTRPAFAPMERGFVSVTGMPGAHLSHSNRQIRQLDIPVRIEGQSITDLQKVKEDLAEWLVHDEPKELTFSDEPDRIYYAVVSGSLDLDELVRVGIGVITFLCPDPFKYGQEKTLEFNTDAVVVENKGTAEADPIFELRAKEKTTFAMISDGTNYNLIGKPADDDTEIVDTKQKLYELTNMDGWSYDGIKSDSRWPKVTGTMQHDGTGMRPNLYGDGEKIHGPGVIRELPETAQDFEVNTIFDVISDRDIDNFRLQVDLFDENMNNIGMLGVKDNNRYKKLRIGMARFGAYRGGGKSNGYLIGEDNYTHEFGNNASLHLSFKRVGKKIEVKVGRWYARRLIETLTETYHDVNNDYQGKLKYIQVLIGSFGDRAKPARLRINKIDVFKLTQATVDQTPYILDVGDIVTFDHKDDEILINGEPRNDMKNFGGSFFRLNKGDNTLLVTPEDSFDTEVTYRDKYL